MALPPGVQPVAMHCLRPPRAGRPNDLLRPAVRQPPVARPCRQGLARRRDRQLHSARQSPARQSPAQQSPAQQSPSPVPRRTPLSPLPWRTHRERRARQAGQPHRALLARPARSPPRSLCRLRCLRRRQERLGRPLSFPRLLRPPPPQAPPPQAAPPQLPRPPPGQHRCRPQAPAQARPRLPHRSGLLRVPPCRLCLRRRASRRRQGRWCWGRKTASQTNCSGRRWRCNVRCVADGGAIGA